MFETLVRVFAGALAGYAGIGLTFAFVFVSVGVQRLDPLARGVGFGFRLSILPGVTAFWPVFLSRGCASSSSRHQKILLTELHEPRTNMIQPSRLTRASF